MANNDLFRAPTDPACIRIAPFGGCGEFGMNLTAYLHAGRLFVVDAGVRFPDPIRLGVDAVLPDVSPHFAQIGQVNAYLITHGHEDHIGALPHLVQRWPAPIYATPWTAELIKAKFIKYGVAIDQHPITVVEPGDKVACEDFEVEYIHVNHSIPHACALFLRTKDLKIFHTGDFKIERDPVLEAPLDLSRLQSLAGEGVDLLVADSTNAERPGHCPGEASVFEPLRAVVAKAAGAVFITTFSSNLWRLKTIADVAQATGRRIFVAGGGLEATFTIGQKLELYALSPGLRIPDEQELNRTERSKLIILATGCQGEYRSALARVAVGEHKTVKVSPGDVVVFSSRIIPGNEKPILTMIDALKRQGARIVTTRDAPGIHVSGHAYGADLELLRAQLRPRMYLPVHGAFSQLDANGYQASAQGYTSHAVESGDVVELRPGSIKTLGQIDVDLHYVDGESGVVIPHSVLRDRLRIGELGCAILTGVFQRKRRDWLVKPECSLLGLQLPAAIAKNDGAFQASVEKNTRQALAELVQQKNLTDEDIFEELRIRLRRQLAAVLKKKPVVIVKLHLV